MTANHDLQSEAAKCETASSLLQEFGARLGGWSPGVMLYVGSNEQTTINLDGGGWAWLEPLLVELQQWRKVAKNSVEFYL